MSNQSEFLTCSAVSADSRLPPRLPTLWPTPEGMAGGKTSRGGDRKGELLLGGMVRDLSALPTPRSSPSPAPSITATFPIRHALGESRMLRVIRSLSDAVACRMSSAGAFHANRTVVPGNDSPAQTSATYGANVGVFLGTFDPDSHCGKTSAACLQASQDFFSIAYLATWPRFGTLVNGKLYQQPPLELRTGGIESGCCVGMSWPTPTKQDGENCAGPSQLLRNSDPLNVAVLRGHPLPDTGPADRASSSMDGSRPELWRTPTDDTKRGGSQDAEKRKAGGHTINLADQVHKQGKLNPHWVFCLMGYPPLWAEIGRKFTTGSRSSKRQATP